ncbi:protein kinase [Nocardioides sp. SYSU D00038]|uniref:serine/threonine protein kinase n=1 Tax=Nocardioides sp. SYSU D00038 TaxID=2812554 RepID=UPI0027DE3883|nr:protein kinase [Nocardioides sp. SYSU D00038]
MTQTPPPPGGETYVDAGRRYRLESRIATGGMGEVWRGTDTALERPVAVKLLKSEYADDPTFRHRFETEAQHAAALHHPGVASVYDVGESPATDGSGIPRPFLVMELVDGQPLSALLRGGRPLDPVVVRDLMAQAADAIGAAHRAGIVHRDVKPANLLVTPDRQIKITDFGIARASDGLGLTGTGQVMGTPQYLSPEQARGNPATAASDVYSLGVVAWECLVGHRPFDAESAVATALAHLNDPVPPLPDTVPPDLAAVVLQALSKDPARRFADGAAFATALRSGAAAVPPADDEETRLLGAAAAPAGFAATAATGSTPHVDPTPTPVAMPRADDEDDGASRGMVWGAVALVALLGAAAVVIALLLTGDGKDQPDDSPSTTPSSRPSTPSSAPTSEEPEEITLDPSAYVGRDVDEVLAELRQLGLEPEAQPQANDGSQPEDVVTGVSPTSGLTEGDVVVVSHWGPPPETEAPPDPEPSDTPEPSETTEPSDPETSEASQPSTPATPTTPAATGTTTPSTQATTGREGTR